MPDHVLKGKVAFVTGAASGLGAALADELAAAGAHIAAADICAEPLYAGVARLWERGSRAEAIPLDLTDPDAVRAAVERCLARLGGLDILVNNAGTDVTLPLTAPSEQDWLRVIGTHLSGPFLLARQAAAHMLRQGSGDIVNVAADAAAKRARSNAGTCHASKWGLLGLSHALHAELRPHGIRVTAVIASGMRMPGLLDGFPHIDAGTLQDAARVARAIRQVLELSRETVVPELTVLPMQESGRP